MKKVIPIVFAIALCSVATSCITLSRVSVIDTGTRVSSANFYYVKTVEEEMSGNDVGKVLASVKKKADLQDNQALLNVTIVNTQQSFLWFITNPTTTITADVIEFIEPGKSATKRPERQQNDKGESHDNGSEEPNINSIVDRGLTVLKSAQNVIAMPQNNNHSYVDLGLSVKWATCNVGAKKPEDYGDYYAWGEIETKGNYDWSTYKWCNGSYSALTKYCISSSNGTVDNKTVLDSEDDVAHAKWGGTWRMPTKAEQDELRNECTWQWTTIGGHNGYLVTSKKNGKSIFLPAAGSRNETTLNAEGSYGYYWSSSLGEKLSSSAFDFFFSSSGVDWSNSRRYHGLSVRPVCP